MKLDVERLGTHRAKFHASERGDTLRNQGNPGGTFRERVLACSVRNVRPFLSAQPALRYAHSS